MALTADEQRELELLEQVDAVSNTSEVTSGLSQDEQDELSLLESVESGSPISDNTDPTGIPKQSDALAAARSTAQGLSLGFSDEIIGTVNAGVRKLTGDNAPFHQLQQEEIAFQRQELASAKEQLGGVGTALDIGGGLVSGVATGGLTAGVRGAAILGGVTSVGISNKTGSELAGDFFTGAATGAIFQKGIESKAAKSIFNVVGKQISKASDKVKSFFESSSKARHPLNVQAEAATIRDMFTSKHGIADEYFFTAKARKQAVEGIDSSVEIVNDAVTAEMRLLGNQLKQAKSELGDPKLNFSGVIQKFEATLKEIPSVSGNAAAMKHINNTILKPLKEGESLLGKSINLSKMSIDEAHILKKAIAKDTYNAKDPAHVFKGATDEVNSAVKQFTDDIVESFNDISPAIREVNKQFKLMYAIDDVRPRNPAEVVALIDELGTSSAAQRGREFVQALNGKDPIFAHKVLTELTPNLKRFSAVAESQPGAAEFGALRFGPLSAVFAAGKSGVNIAAQVSGKLTRQVRDAFKVPRSVSGIIQNKDIVVSKLAERSPALAVTLNQLIEDRDVEGIKQLATAVLQDAEAAQGFEPGIGFEGQITSPEEMQMVEGEIKRMRIRPRAKLELLNGVRATGMIPNLGAAQEQSTPFQRVFEKRKRDQHGRKETEF